MEPIKELRERHLGVLEGLTRTEAAQQFPTDFSALGTPDAKPQARFLCFDHQAGKLLITKFQVMAAVQGGESQSDVKQRVVAKVEQIALQHPGRVHNSLLPIQNIEQLN